MTRREVADVQHSRGETHRLSHLTLGEKPVSDAALIEHLDRARVKAAGPRADEHVIGTSLDDRDIDPCQCQLSRQHHSRRTATDDHNRMLAHSHAPSDIDDNSRIFDSHWQISGFRERFYSTIRGLMKGP